MMNKNGFISMTLVYSFLILFLFLMLAILDVYSTKNNYLNTINERVSKDLNLDVSYKNTIKSRMQQDGYASLGSTDIAYIVDHNICYVYDSVDLDSHRIILLKDGNYDYLLDTCTIVDENGKPNISIGSVYSKDNDLCSDKSSYKTIGNYCYEYVEYDSETLVDTSKTGKYGKMGGSGTYDDPYLF